MSEHEPISGFQRRLYEALATTDGPAIRDWEKQGFLAHVREVAETVMAEENGDTGCTSPACLVALAPELANFLGHDTFGHKTTNALVQADYMTVDQVAKLTDRDLRDIDNLGTAGIKRIRQHIPAPVTVWNEEGQKDSSGVVYAVPDNHESLRLGPGIWKIDKRGRYRRLAKFDENQATVDELAHLRATIERVLLDHVDDYNRPAGEADPSLAELAIVYQQLTGFDAVAERAKDQPGEKST